ncbi:Uncharacterised protein [Candidatus Bilamarchaeum dharawalense]|uniref:Uncharacterized protein n=1 Tax=Candidatus Bilamarchaeum dharawalense TaxID=2885759 RepID=A0A5E4LPS0_9ARCH|nr:Uncharacterised protein [Candidatus Bilamarchaeum dharawalense]
MKIDLSTLSLIAVNIVVIFFALQEGYHIGVLVWIFWFQSLIIGIFHTIKLVSLNKTNISFYSIPLVFGTLLSFLFYVALHLFFLLFVYALAPIESLNFHIPINCVYNHQTVPCKVYPLDDSSVNFILMSVLLFFINHLISFIVNIKRDLEKMQGSAVYSAINFLVGPYPRILPMHIIICFSFFLGQFESLLLIGIIKTIVDVAAHQFEHN